jgi:hypothetical protein
MNPSNPAPGTDTPTGTDPEAKYSEPGYQDKSLGQAVNSDEELVEDLLEETGGDVEAAEERFEHESAGAPRLADQNLPEASKVADAMEDADAANGEPGAQATS